MNLDGRLVVWFSCGAASACALKLLAPLKPTAVYCSVAINEHPDNQRFLVDVQHWTGVDIHTIRNAKHETIEEVFEKKRYMSGIKGAPCTVAMKKVPRFAFQQPDDVHVFGMTTDESKRIREFAETNHDLHLLWPLLRAGMSKADCFTMLAEAGIKRSAMYDLGYKNANCIGCVKSSSPAYWNLVRKTHPEVFASRCEQSRRLGVKLIRIKKVRRFLDELPPDDTTDLGEDLSCGPQCTIQPDEEDFNEQDFWGE